MALCDLEDQLFLHCYLSSSLLERKKNFTPGKSLPSSSFCRLTMSPSQRQEREEPGADGSVITIYVLHIAAHITSREGVFLPYFRFRKLMEEDLCKNDPVRFDCKHTGEQWQA